MSDTFLYIVEGDKNSEEAIRILNKHGVGFQRIIVSKEGNGKSMWRDLETTKIPTLHSPKGIFIGVKEIEKFCKQ
jgi:hypothetical protein